MGDVAAKESGKLQRGLIGCDFRLIAVVLLIHGHPGVGPAQKIRAAIGGHAQECGDDMHR